jgi:hypothetical protein
MNVSVIRRSNFPTGLGGRLAWELFGLLFWLSWRLDLLARRVRRWRVRVYLCARQKGDTHDEHFRN